MPNKSLAQISFLFLIITLLALGIYFRVTNLDTQIYWHDEVFTSLRVSGFTEAETVKQVFNGQPITVKDLDKYQNANGEKGVGDIIKGLAVEDSQHPPLYFLLARLWEQVFGGSVAVKRCLPALLSLLVFPSVYWLCLELFHVPVSGWVAMGILAISPFHVLFAQESREYSLWTVSILLSSAALLRAMRLKSIASWAVYTLTLTLSLYTFLFSVLVAIGHGIYVIVTERFRLTQTTIAYLLASFTGLLLSIPWILTVAINLSTIRASTAWMTKAPAALSNRLTLVGLLKKWLQGLSYVFVDPGVNYRLKNIILLILVGYAFYFLARTVSRQAFLFVLTLTLPTFLVLALPDVILGGNRSTIYRYLIPSYLGIQIAVASLLAFKISDASVKSWQRSLWRVVMIAVFSVGIFSCYVNSKTEVPWSKAKGQNQYNSEIAKVINEANNPLLVSDVGLGDIFSLAHKLKPEVRLQLITTPNVPRIADRASTFVFNPSDQLRLALEKSQSLKLEPVEPKKLGGQLWTVVKN